MVVATAGRRGGGFGTAVVTRRRQGSGEGGGEGGGGEGGGSEGGSGEDGGSEGKGGQGCAHALVLVPLWCASGDRIVFLAAVYTSLCVRK